MTDEPEKRHCRVCDRELEIFPEEPEGDSHIPLYYCEPCGKLYRFVLVD